MTRMRSGGTALRLMVIVMAAWVAPSLAGPSAPAHTESAAQAESPVSVTNWVELELDIIAANRLNPPRAARALALVSRAMYDAAVLGRVAQDAAVAAAASTVLLHLFPGEAERITALREQALAGLEPREILGVEVGTRVGRRLVARADADGSDATWTVIAPAGAGSWVPTPPAFVFPPLEPLAGTWRTWNLESGSQFRPGPPPAYGSAAYLAELREVHAVSQSLTGEQKRIATFWADGAGTVTPPGHWNRIAIEEIRHTGWSTQITARLFAALNTAQADAFIACWDAKYVYWSARPVTAIRAALDPSWLPFIATPPFPSYVSGHSTTSAAAATVLSAFLPERALAVAAMAEEAAVSRLYGGIHFRSDNDAGIRLGKQVGLVAMEAYSRFRHHDDLRPGSP